MSGPSSTVPTHTATLTARDLTNLVAPVLPFTDRTGFLPLLWSVKIEAHGPHLVAMATDRYRIGVKRIVPEITPDPKFAALVPASVLARIRSTFKHTRRSNPSLRLEVTGDVLRVSGAEEFEGLFDASFSFRLPNPVADYPDIQKLLVKALSAEPPAEPTAGSFNPHFLADFAAASAGAQTMRLSPSGPADKPWIVRVGDDFLGLIVPIRHEVGEDTAAVRADWLALLQPAPVKVARKSKSVAA